MCISDSTMGYRDLRTEKNSGTSTKTISLSSSRQVESCQSIVSNMSSRARSSFRTCEE